MISVLGHDFFCLLLGLFVYGRVGHLVRVTDWATGGVHHIIPADSAQLSEAVKHAAKDDYVEVQPAGSVNRKKKQRRKEAEQRLREAAALPKETEPMSIPFFRLRLRLGRHPFGKELELLLSWSILGLLVFALSETIFCFSRKVAKQSSTTVFLSTTVMLCLAFLFCVNRESWRADRQLSSVLGILSFFWSGLFVGMSSGDRKLKSLSRLDFSPHIAKLTDFLAQGQEHPREDVESLVWWGVTFLVSAFCAYWTAMIVLSCFRFARVYHESTTLLPQSEEEYLYKGRWDVFLSHVVFFSPLLMCLLYVDPMLANPLKARTGLSDSAWEAIRHYSCLLLALLRVSAFPRTLQAYFDSSYLVARQMLSEPKRFASGAIEQSMNNAYRFAGVASIQYVAPSLAIFFALLLRLRFSSFSGLCGLSQNLVGVAAGASSADQSRPGFLEKLLVEGFGRTLPVGGLNGLFPVPLVSSLLDTLILWMSLSWMVCSLCALAYWLQTSVDGNTARRFADVYATKSKKAN